MSVYVYGLTALTGRKRNQGRKVVVNGFEVGRRTLVVGSIGLGIAIIPAGILSAIFGPLGFILTIGTIVPATFLLMDGRTRKAPDLPLYKSVLDRRKWRPQLMVCWQPIPTSSTMALVRRSSIDQVAETDSPRGETVWGEQGEKPARRRFDFMEGSA